MSKNNKVCWDKGFTFQFGPKDPLMDIFWDFLSLEIILHVINLNNWNLKINELSPKE